MTAFAAEEIAAEQRHVDQVYARLEVIKKEAAQIEARARQVRDEFKRASQSL